MVDQNPNIQNQNDQKADEQKANDQILKNKKLRIARPNSILVDIYGVITSWDFAKQLKLYVRNNLSEYLTRNWADRTVAHIVTKLREQSEIDRSAGIQMPAVEKEEPNKPVDVIIKSVVDSILWQMDNKHEASQIQLDNLFYHIWFDAYNTCKLKTHAFKDVKTSMEHWRYDQFIKIYSYASGPPEGQKLFLRSSVEGDLSAPIANCIDSSGGYKYDKNKYRCVISALRESDPKMLLYLTDDPKKAGTAIEAGMRAVVVLRPANPKYSQQQLKHLDTITSFDQLVFEEQSGKATPCC